MFRSSLIDRLIERHHLLEVVRAACAEARIEGREEAVAFCLVVLAQKRDAVSRYGLDPDGDFDAALAERAAEVAGHLRADAATYQVIQDEGERHELTTLRGIVRTRQGDDVLDQMATLARDLLIEGVPLDEMTLDLARHEEPTGNEYVFQSPLEGWIRLTARRAAPTSAVPLEMAPPGEEALKGPGPLAEIVRSEATGEELLGLIVRWVDELAERRDLLNTLIERADGIEAEVARMRPASRTHGALLVRLRATIADVADRLRRERLALRDALSYIVLGMVGATQLQAVAILSLRHVTIAPEVARALTGEMRALIADAYHPTPALVRKAEAAVGEVVPRKRATTLAGLQEDRTRRAARLAEVTELLDLLPEAVADSAAIAIGIPKPCTVGAVATQRHQAGRELDEVDRWMGSAYRRYTKGAT